MASIGSLASTYRAAYNPNPYQSQKVSTAQSAGKTSSSPAVESGDREQDLTQKLDSQLTEQLSRIRQQITSPDSNGAAGAEGVGRTLDIRA
jgi:hypothetical protein